MMREYLTIAAAGAIAGAIAAMTGCASYNSDDLKAKESTSADNQNALTPNFTFVVKDQAGTVLFDETNSSTAFQRLRSSSSPGADSSNDARPCIT